MKTIENETDTYGLGYGTELTSIFSNRTLEKQCAYLTPCLEKGMRVLDVGCGPGSITLGIAKKVTAEGSVVGVDIDEGQLKRGRYLAEKENISHLSFINGNVSHLPFPDSSFDITHMSGLLCQVDNLVVALDEIRRVTKPGGIIACREPIFECYIIYPDSGLFKESIRLATYAVNSLGSDFNLGKKLKSIFTEEYFSSTSFSLSCESQISSAAVQRLCNSLLEDWDSSPWSQYIRENNLADEDTIASYIQAIKEVSQSPHAILSIPWGEAVCKLH